MPRIKNKGVKALRAAETDRDFLLRALRELKPTVYPDVWIPHGDLTRRCGSRMPAAQLRPLLDELIAENAILVKKGPRGGNIYRTPS
jgi:hypothetical protein